MMSEQIRDNKLEEIRAFFVLGLLAVLASIRTQTFSVPTKDGTLPLNPIIDVMLVFMSLYALFMIFGYSKDLVGETIASFFRSMAIQFLILNLVFVLMFGILYAFAYYQNRLLWMIALIAIPAGYVGLLKFNQIKKNRLTKNKDKKRLTRDEKLLIVGQTLSGFGVAICALMISYYASEQAVWVFFVIGAVSMIFWLYFVNLKNKEKTESTSITITEDII